jgi:signal transduction histidine kinase
MDIEQNNDISIKLKTTGIKQHPVIRSRNTKMDNFDSIRQIINSYPHISLILNKNRQIVLSNQQLFDMTGLENLGQIIGGRPGEAMNCIHKDDNNGCGLSESCRFCNIVNSIIESQSQLMRISHECRITTRSQGRLVFHDYRVICSPIWLNNQHYTLVNLVDISSDKRNQMLENIFFHDVLNRLGALSGIVQMIRSENKQSELDEYIDVLDTIGELVIEDIQTQRFLKAAESAKLIVNIREHSVFEIAESVRKQICFNPIMKTRQLDICIDCSDFRLKTDAALLKRILLNMAKNAAEASPENSIIRIICSQKTGMAVIRVNNPGTIPANIRTQIFQRSFSTKGHGRGLGTYSMKLFGENYLNGKVYFQSNEKQGTTFTIELPLDS